MRGANTERKRELSNRKRLADIGVGRYRMRRKAVAQYRMTET